MADRIELKRIEFHEGGATYNYRGTDGYSISDRGGITVTFQINEGGGAYLQLTETVEGSRFPSYDAIVDRAYLQLQRRLEAFGKTAEGLQRFHDEKAARAKAEPTE